MEVLRDAFGVEPNGLDGLSVQALLGDRVELVGRARDAHQIVAKCSHSLHNSMRPYFGKEHEEEVPC